MSNKIYHNPQWGKSRKSVEILKKSQIDFSIIQFLKNPPSMIELKDICFKLKIHPKDLLRTNDIAYKKNNIEKFIENENVLYKKMIKFPIIIERPIIIIGEKAVIGRPPEKILEIL